ncbi:MAG: tetratricopeptide repeat-containing sensor histidine kinase [Ignavibacteria bacterium]|jgi:signal transduction histidine kinase
MKLYNLLINFLLIALVYTNAVAQEDTVKVKELLASASDKTKPYTEIIKLTDDAIIVCDKINYPRGKADALNIKGKAYLKLGEYSGATNAFFEELELREKNPEWKNSSVGNVYTLIGESFRAVANFSLAIEYLNKALIINIEKKDEKEIAHTYNRLAAVYFEVIYRWGDTTAVYKAEEYANKSLEISKKLNEKDLTISTYNIIGVLYSVHKDFDNALKYFMLAVEEADKDSTYADKPNILNNMTGVYNIKGDYEKGLKYGLQSYELSKKSDIKVYIIGAARNLSDAYAKTGNYQKAFDYQVEANDLYVQIFDERKTAEIYGLQKKYETELEEKENKAKMTGKIIIGIAVILLVITISVGVYSRHKQQVLLNKGLSQKNELINTQKEELARSNIAKDKFFSILSHDIRNPLNGILGFSNILDSDFEQISDEEKKEYIGYLKTSSESLFRLIDRLLVWSRLQTGKVEINKEKINLYELISGVMGLQKANAIRKGIILDNEIHQEVNVIADKNVLDMVSRNLLDNAVKFTGAGGKITIKSETTDNNVLISFIDTGVGISKEDLNKIFLIDQKIVSKGTDSEEGTGLGLILCKEMLELIGSTLKVESEEKKGTRFFFELPLS